MNALNRWLRNGDLKGDFYTDGFRIMDGLMKE